MHEILQVASPVANGGRCAGDAASLAVATANCVLKNRGDGPPRFQHLAMSVPSRAVPLHNIWCACGVRPVVLQWG